MRDDIGFFTNTAILHYPPEIFELRLCQRLPADYMTCWLPDLFKVAGELRRDGDRPLRSVAFQNLVHYRPTVLPTQSPLNDDMRGSLSQLHTVPLQSKNFLPAHTGIKPQHDKRLRPGPLHGLEKRMHLIFGQSCLLLGLVSAAL